MKYFVIVLLLLTCSIWAKAEPYEFVVAEVDGQIILNSDLMDAVYQLKNAPGFVGLSSEKLKEKVLERLIDDKVIMARAQRDTISVGQTEIDSRVDAHLQSLLSRQGGKMEELEQAIKMQLGITMAQYKQKIGSQIRQQGILQQMQMKYVGRIEPTKKEVSAFYDEYKDSLPLLYDAVHIGYIQRKVKPSRSHVDSAFTLAQSLIDSLDRGASFDSLARKYSADAADKGGDIGFYRRGKLDPSYERAAFRLKLGKYTDRPVKSDYGFHIIKKLAEKDGEVRSAHILLKLTPTTADTQKVVTLLDSIKTVVESSKIPQQKFLELARNFSSDEEIDINGGDLGWFPRSELDTSYHRILNPLQVGELSSPTISNGEWSLFYLMEQEAEKQMTIEENFADIEQMAINVLTNRKLQIFVERWRKEIFIDLRSSKQLK